MSAATNKFVFFFLHRRPKHVLTFIRPKEGQPPNLATFKVPLTFNKFDFRDYLWNCYGVEVNSVRSFINQQRAKQRSFGGTSNGKWYRPRSIKMMIADLKQPFVWPDPPQNLDPWDHKLFISVEEGHEKRNKEAEQMGKYGPRRVRSRSESGPTRTQLSMAAKLLAYGLTKWKPQSETTRMIQAAQYAKVLKPEEEVEEDEAETSEQGGMVIERDADIKKEDKTKP